jgi:hypothetical protein
MSGMGSSRADVIVSIGAGLAGVIVGVMVTGVNSASTAAGEAAVVLACNKSPT